MPIAPVDVRPGRRRLLAWQARWATIAVVVLLLNPSRGSGQTSPAAGLPLDVLHRGDVIRMSLRDPVAEVPRAAFLRWEGPRLVYRLAGATTHDAALDRIRRLDTWQSDGRKGGAVRRNALWVGGTLGAITAIAAISFSRKDDRAAIPKALGAGAAVGLVGGAAAGLVTHVLLREGGVWVRVRVP